MGRGSTNENTNMYFQARKKAATYNERLWSREGAAELLGISVSTLADYELGKHVPFKVRHNLLVLAFIIREPKPKSEIMKLLGISQESVYDNVIQQGISDLVQLYYGYEI